MKRESVNRHTGPKVTDPEATAALEARNALLQFDEVRRLIAERMGDLQLTRQDVCHLQAIAVKDIWPNPGECRKKPIGVSNTPHEPPPWQEVESLLDEMCDYANSISEDGIAASAYLMWRLNWIHPFPDGNGRTSRAISYLALCCGLGMELPGTVTVPDLIVRNRNPYYLALDAADLAWKQGKVDTSQMQDLIRDLLTEQLESME